mmetsp:Transcript_29902/g.93502  ORF Transcript_29902/g.93502 Transcript_29902/m.93502 type:complete len:812 (-) Transcript_29902:58-2493(-)
MQWAENLAQRILRKARSILAQDAAVQDQGVEDASAGEAEAGEATEEVDVCCLSTAVSPAGGRAELPGQAADVSLSSTTAHQGDGGPGNPTMPPAQALEHSLTKDSLTPSIRDLFDHGPGLVLKTGWKAWFCLHFGRLLAVNVGDCKLLPREDECLIKELGFGNRAAQFCAWRFSLLYTGVFFFASITVIDALLVADVWETRGRSSVIMRRVDPRYHEYFQGLNDCNWVQSVGLLVASIASVCFAGVAAHHWKSLRRSRKWAVASFGCSYLPPFVLLLVIPFRNSIDFEGIQVQMCNDMLNMSMTFQDKRLWPGKVGQLRKTLHDAYSIELPPDFCLGEPVEWGTRIRILLDEGGFLARENGTCDRSDRAVQKLDSNIQAHLASEGGVVSLGPINVSVGVGGAGCPAACRNCTRVCLPHLLRLTALASVHGTAVLDGVSLGGVADHCTHCVSRAAELQCQFKCPELTTQLDHQAILGTIPLPGKPCFEAAQAAEFELLVQLGTQTAYWRMLLGAAYAASSLTILLPLAFSLMLGAAKGATIAKSLIPYSRVPTVVSTSAALFSFPFVFIIMILIQHVVGNWLTLVGIVLVLIAFLASMKPGTLKAESTAEMQKRQSILGQVGAVCAVLAVIVFLVVFGVSDIADAIYNTLREQNWELTMEDLRALGSQTTWAIVNMVCTIFGKSLISTVFFGDSVVSLMYRFHKGEDNDHFRVQSVRTKLVNDLASVYQDIEKCEAVCPQEGSEPDVTSDEIADQHRAMLVAKLKRTARVAKIQRRLQEIEKVERRVLVRSAARQFGNDAAQVAHSAMKMVD